MHTAMYFLVVAPGLVAACVLLSLGVYLLDAVLKESGLVEYYEPTTVDYSKAVVFAALLPFIFKLVGFMRNTINFSENTLFDLRKTNFDRFYMPALEEALKFAMVCYLAHPKCDLEFPDQKRPVGLSIKEIAVAALSFCLANLLPSLYENCPISYTSHFKRFLELHSLWMEHERSTAAQKTDTAMLLAESLKMDPDPAFPCKNSRNTVISVDHENTFLFPSTFTVSQPKKGTLVKFKSTPILSSKTLALPIAKQNEPDLTPYSELVERLYSVSPKNTYHSNKVIMQALASMDNKEQPRKTTSLYEERHFEENGPIVITFEPTPQEIPSVPVERSTNNRLTAGESATSLKSGPSLLLSEFLTLQKCHTALTWFRWLLPFGELLESDFCVRSSTRPNKGIKKKLSLYTINSRMNSTVSDLLSFSDSISARSGSASSYGTFDLENQKERTSVANVSYSDFFRFVQRYFDLNLCSLSNSVSIDPIFVEFSVLNTEFHSVHFILFKLSDVIWSFSTLLVFALPFIVTSIDGIWGAFLGILVLKFFNSNYLSLQWGKGYTVVLPAKVLINCVLLMCCIFYYVQLPV